VRLAALNLEGDLRVDLGGLGSESVIQRISGFHLNSRVLTSPGCHLFVVQFRRIRDFRCAWELLNVANYVPGHLSA